MSTTTTDTPVLLIGQSVNPRWNDREETRFATLTEAIQELRDSLIAEVQGTDWGDEPGDELASRQRLIRSLSEEGAYDGIRATIVEYGEWVRTVGEPTYEPVRFTIRHTD